MKRREQIQNRVTDAVKERVADAVKERVADAVKERVADAIRNKVIDIAADKAVELATERSMPAVKNAAQAWSNHPVAFWSQDEAQVKKTCIKSTQENRALVSIQISMTASADDKVLIDNLLTNHKFRILKELFHLFTRKDEFYALILERKITEYLQANAKNQLISALAGKVINSLDDFYQQFQQRKQPQQTRQISRPKVQHSHTQVTTASHASVPLTTEVNSASISKIENILMLQYELDYNATIK